MQGKAGVSKRARGGQKAQAALYRLIDEFSGGTQSTRDFSGFAGGDEDTESESESEMPRRPRKLAGAKATRVESDFDTDTDSEDGESRSAAQSSKS